MSSLEVVVSVGGLIVGFVAVWFFIGRNSSDTEHEEKTDSQNQ